MFRKIFNKESKLIGFDVFENLYPQTEQNEKQREHWVQTGGKSYQNLSKIFKLKVLKILLLKAMSLQQFQIFKKNKKLKQFY